MSGDRSPDMQQHEDTGDNWLAAALHDDEHTAPSAGLWPRIERSHRRRRLRRQLLHGVGAALLLGCIGGLVWQPWPLPTGLQTVATVDDAAVDDAAASEADALQAAMNTGTARLRQIDRQLESAYARGDDDAIDALWQRRERMLNTLDQDPDDEARTLLSL